MHTSFITEDRYSIDKPKYIFYFKSKGNERNPKFPVKRVVRKGKHCTDFGFLKQKIRVLINSD